MENEYVLSMEGISKQFPGVRALSNVKLECPQGKGARADGRKRRR